MENEMKKTEEDVKKIFNDAKKNVESINYKKSLQVRFSEGAGDNLFFINEKNQLLSEYSLFLDSERIILCNGNYKNMGKRGFKQMFSGKVLITPRMGSPAQLEIHYNHGETWKFKNEACLEDFFVIDSKKMIDVHATMTLYLPKLDR